MHLGEAATFDNHAFALGCVLLAAAYAGSSLAAIGEMLIMNNVVSKHFTCAIRIRMSDKIRRLPVRYVDVGEYDENPMRGYHVGHYTKISPSCK